MPSKAEERETLRRNWCQFNYEVLTCKVVSEDCGETGEYIRRVYVIAHNMPEAKVKEFVGDQFPAEHCHHSHDCCGNYYKGAAAILSNQNGYVVVSQTASQNI